MLPADCKAVLLKNALLSCQVEAYPEQNQNICFSFKNALKIRMKIPHLV